MRRLCSILATMALVGLISRPLWSADESAMAGKADAAHGHDHGGDHGHGHGPKLHGETPKNYFGKFTELLYVSPQLFIWTLLIFLPTWFILSTVVWKPYLHLLEKREHKIAASLAEAEKAREEAKRLLAEQDEILAKAHEQAKSLLENARADASKEAEGIVTQARDLAAKSVADAAEQIGKARAEALAELRSSAVGMAEKMASSLADRSISASNHAGLVEEVLR